MQCKIEGKLFFIVALFVTIFGSSCVTHRDLISLNGGENLPKGEIPDSVLQRMSPVAFEAYRVRPNDQLFVRINSFEGSTGDFINQNLSSQSAANRQGFDPSTIYFNSYTVNDSGYIKLPILEDIKVTGFTTTEIQDHLNAALKPYLKLASADVKLGNRRVTLLGEVASPGVQYLYNEKNTLLEALGLAGDITPFGNRKKVKLIRQTETGVETVYLNLNRSDFITTPYFYIQPNDVVYVEPLKAKSFDQSSRAVGVVISSISLAVIIANIFIK